MAGISTSLALVGLTLGLAGPAPQQARDAGAQIVRIDVGWPAVTRPTDPSDPADPAYDWTAADRAVDAARAAGLDVLASTTGAPPWARRPQAADAGAYGRALATHYAGRVRAFQLGSKPQRSAPAAYRALLNAFYAGVKRADPSGLVVTAATATRGAERFWRRVLSRPTRFDVLAHEPSWPAGPTHHAPSGDVAFPDLGRLRRLLEHVHSRARLWVTGASFGAGHAPWLEHALELLWRGGVDTVIWSGLPDQASGLAFRFPFVAGGDQIWTRAPLSGTLVIRRNGHRVRSIGVTGGQVLLLHGIATHRGDVFTGAVGDLRSLPWRATH